MVVILRRQVLKEGRFCYKDVIAFTAKFVNPITSKMLWAVISGVRVEVNRGVDVNPFSID